MPRGDHGHQAARDVGQRAVLDRGMRDARRRCAASSSSMRERAQVRRCRLTSTSSSGCARRRFSIGPSDWLPRHDLAHAVALREQARPPRRRCGLRVVEGRRLSCRLRAASPASSARRLARSAARMHAARSAARRPRRRAPRSASLTALAIAAGGPIAPLSPMPFWPNSVYGDGRLHVLDADRRHLGRARQQIVGERRGERLALVAEGHLLVQRRADALRRAAVAPGRRRSSD